MRTENERKEFIMYIFYVYFDEKHNKANITVIKIYGSLTKYENFTY